VKADLIFIPDFFVGVFPKSQCDQGSGNTVAFSDAGPETRASFCCNPRDPEEVARERQDFISK
jgi:hypothetical protein